jgi:hypothetical protein
MRIRVNIIYRRELLLQGLPTIAMYLEFRVYVCIELEMEGRIRIMMTECSGEHEEQDHW